MGSLAIEINDAGLVVAQHGRVLGVEPGYAMVAGDHVVSGEAARAQARLKPRLVSSRYWSNLSIESGTAGLDGIDSAAELALAQLESLAERYGTTSNDVIFVVPSQYRRDQLGVLLGLAQECGIRVRALVDNAAAASLRPYPEHELLLLDAGLHQTSLTVLDQAGHEVAVRAVEQLEGVGLASVSDQWVRRIADLFVLTSRFDPLHQADTEQLLYEHLPSWLAALQNEDSAELALVHSGERFTVELRREQLLSVAQGFYRALVQLVSQVRTPGARLVVQLSGRLAALPGLGGELLRIDDAQVVPLALGQAALGALAAADALDAGSGQVRLLKRLPWRPAPDVALPAAMVQPIQRPERRRRATHVVHRGIAYAVDSAGLVVGRELNGARRAIPLDGAHTGISREHCEITLRDGELRLRDTSRFGTFVNEKKVAGEIALSPADVVRIGSPGEILHVIALDEGHGT